MFYLVLAFEVKNGLRKIEDVPVEVRPAVEKALRDLTKHDKGEQTKWNS